MAAPAFIALLSIALVACDGRYEQGAGRVDPVSDLDRGGIISLFPAATGILLELGVRDRFVARSRADTALLDDPALPDVGDPIAPAMEVIADVEPAVVVALSGMETGSLRRVLPSGAGILEMDITDLESLDRAIESLGEVVEREERAAELRGRLAADLGAASGARSAPSVAWVVWHSPVTLAGHGTFVDAMLSAAGGRNALEAHEGSWPAVGMETLIRRDPDVIVWPRGGGIVDPAAHQGL